jgi:hypothetical protein
MHHRTAKKETPIRDHAEPGYSGTGLSVYTIAEARSRKRPHKAWVPLSTKEMIQQHEKLLRELHRKKREAKYDSERELIQKRIEGKERFLQTLWENFAAGVK